MSRKRELEDGTQDDRRAAPANWRRGTQELHPRAMEFSLPAAAPDPDLHQYSAALVTRAVMEPSGAQDMMMNADLHRRLALGTQVMSTARAAMPMGRGNVDGDNPSFPEAVPRTQEAYRQLDFVNPVTYASKAAVAETTRAGNCDFHAAVGAFNAVRGMTADDVAAVVVEDRHTFAELRPAPGAQPSTVHPHDVVLDSWGTGSHAVMREDSAMGRLIDSPAAPKTVHNTNYTEAVIPKGDEATMNMEHQAARTYLASWDVAGHADRQAAAWRARTPVPGDTGQQYPLQDTQIMQQSAETLAARTALATHFPGDLSADRNPEHVGLEHGYMRELHAAQLLGGVVHHDRRNTKPGSTPPPFLPDVGTAPHEVASSTTAAPARRPSVNFSAHPPQVIEPDAAPGFAPSHAAPGKSILKRG
ncbi:hypothetical protein PMI16_00430 [Herbaspirillum sp. CF444]|uniref:hypothetical protein n=1 Tax=Herbaspirillum sp. CF444 TaxID=1144319 RepID=UPI000272686B|nr:hypothetical protein [Herbaspirillum sp. CF444]EJL94075.1 hypothetical protein PMI16_00430 [Herbaspirillum sp. CF444]